MFAADLEVAVAYDRWFDQPWGRYAFRAETRALLAAVGDVAGRRVVDVGCGTGRFTAELELNAARVIGLDLDPSMLRVAARRVECSLLMGDASTLPFADGSFDVAVAVTLCEFVADPGRVFNQLARVTRPGGHFVVGSLNPRSLWGFANRKQLLDPPWSDARFMSRDELIGLGRRHGRASLTSALFAPEGLPGLAQMGPVLELAGRAFPFFGAFQVLSVQLPR